MKAHQVKGGERPKKLTGASITPTPQNCVTSPWGKHRGGEGESLGEVTAFFIFKSPDQVWQECKKRQRVSKSPPTRETGVPYDVEKRLTEKRKRRVRKRASHQVRRGAEI